MANAASAARATAIGLAPTLDALLVPLSIRLRNRLASPHYSFGTWAGEVKSFEVRNSSERAEG